MSRWPAVRWSDAFPQAALLWSERNDSQPSDYLRGAEEVVWWKCPLGIHPDLQASMRSKRKRPRCPYCSPSSSRCSPDQSLAVLEPELAHQWSTRNELSPHGVRLGSSRKAWWRCPIGEHEDFQRTVASHAKIRTCPSCSGSRPTSTTSFASIHADLTRDWSRLNEHPPDYYLPSSGQVVWWRCPEGAHEDYQRKIVEQVARGGRCRYCTGHLGETASARNSFAALHRELAAQWAPANDVSASQVTDRYSKPVLWTCAQDKHPDYPATIGRRLQGVACPQCARSKAAAQSVAALHPELAQEWSALNSLSPQDCGASRTVTVWWTCERANHPDYERTVRQRLRGTGCSICSSLGFQRPSLVAEWSRLNTTTPLDHGPRSTTVAWWTCSLSVHDDYPSRISSRVGGKGCPGCAQDKRKANSVAILRPDLAREWGAENEREAVNFSIGSRFQAWWTCGEPEHPNYQAPIASRVKRERGCPYCSGHKACPATSLAATHPRIADRWSTRNERSADHYTAGSGHKAWWVCPIPEHPDYRSVIEIRSKRDSQCPVCTGQQAHPTTSLATLRPDLAAEWSPRNDLTPDDVTLKSGRRVEWVCLRHTAHLPWVTAISHRTAGSGCPSCRLVQRSAIELRIAHELVTFYGNDVEDVCIQPVNGRRISADIILRRERIVVEYDGVMFHKSNEKHRRDRAKTAALEAEGWTVVRVRETPLPRLSNLDVIVPASGLGHAPAKTAMNALLPILHELSPLDDDQVASYLAQPHLLNGGAADLYIDQLKRRHRGKR